MTVTLPSHAQAVVIGGGIVGCSIAYHLTKMGWKDVVLLERKQFTSGTTWHAAGLVRASQSYPNLTKLAVYTQNLYTGLEAETGQATGFKQVGSVSIAINDERWDEFKRMASVARGMDVDVDVISPEEAKRRHPLLDLKDVRGAIFFPKDGQCDPGNTALAMAKGARMGGAKTFENVKVTGIRVKDGKVQGVETEHGFIASAVVVNAAGMWGHEVGRMAGVSVPLHAAEHFYAVTEPIPGLPSPLPVLRVMDSCAYVKEDAGKILFGAFEPKAKPWGMDGIPESFCFDELPEDLDQFGPILEAMLERLPVLQNVGMRKFFNGPESFTPDQRYLLGPAPEVKGFYVAAGFNSIGIQSAGGAGMALAHWIVEGHPPFDLWDVDVRRMMPHQGDKSYLFTRVSEALGLLYAMHWPFRQFETARGIRKTPLYENLKKRGACFGEVAGWERGNWFALSGMKPEYEYSWGPQNWYPCRAAEMKTVRERVALLDLSTFAKFRVEGAGVEAAMQKICAANVAVAPGRSVYTQWLNDRGGIEADLTVIRLAPDAFMVVTAAATAVRDKGWLQDHLPAGIKVTDVTNDFGIVGVMGPRARDLLSRLTKADLTNAGFPFGASLEIEVAGIKVRATRVSYVGELGWELHAPWGKTAELYEALFAAGGDLGIGPCGMHAMDALRLEKGYRHWGHDIGEEDTPLESGLAFAVDWSKDFIGKAALLKQKQAGVSRRLIAFKLKDKSAILYHNEPIFRDGKMVGRVTSGSRGETFGCSIGLGYVSVPQGSPPDAALSGKLEVEIGWQKYELDASLKPLWDPTSARMKV